MADKGFKRKLTAILSADVEGYSRLMDDDEEATVRTLTNYRTAIGDLAEQYRGRVVDSPGDNILAEFVSVVDAVNCAVEIQRELAESNEELPDNRKMQFRIGVNLGDVIDEDGRIYGDGVNIASRVESMAEAGGICISGRAFDQVENKLGLEYEDLGEHEVKNIARPIRVYRVLSYPGAAAHRVVKAKESLGRRWRNIAISAAVAILIIGGLAYWQFFMRSPDVEAASVDNMAFPLPDKPSIAVMPFDNMSDDPKQEYIGDAITEHIITGLSKTPKLFVISRYTTFSYKGKPTKVKTVAEELGVKYVLEGSVQKSGERVRITAQLIDALSGYHVWAEHYDRDFNDIFALQDEITMKVITALQVKLTDGDIANIYSKGTNNFRAFLKLLEGYEHLLRETRDDNEVAKALFEEAIALDPEYSNAYMMLGGCYFIESFRGWSKSRLKSEEKHLELAKKAISLDEYNLKAHMQVALHYAFKRQPMKALDIAKKAFSYHSNSSHANAWYGHILYSVGKTKEAIPFLERALRYDPFPLNWVLRIAGWAYLITGQTVSAVTTFQKLNNRELTGYYAYSAPVALGHALRLAGRPEEATEMFEKAMSSNSAPNGVREWCFSEIAKAHFEMGQHEEAIKMLKEVLRRNVNRAIACLYLSDIQMHMGRNEEALEMAKEAMRLNRGSPFWFPYFLGRAHWNMGQFEEAIAAFTQGVEAAPDNLYYHIGLAASYSSAGRAEDARAEVEEILRINPNYSVEQFSKVSSIIDEGTKEKYFAALRKAGLPE